MITIKREPTSPGEILQEDFLTHLRISQKQLTDHLGCDVKVINRIVNNKTSVTAEMAVKLGAGLMHNYKRILSRNCRNQMSSPLRFLCLWQTRGLSGNCSQ